LRKPEFQLEADMAIPVLEWLRRNELTVKQEFTLPWGICDVIGISLDRKRTELRLAHGQSQPIGTPRRLFLLSKIPDTHMGRSITRKRLRKELQEIMSANVFDRELDRLIRSRFVHCPKRGYLQSRNGWAPLHKRIVTVELKLSRISQAFMQAQSHLAFATESYVALPSHTARRVAESQLRRQFNETGVGILAVGSNSCVPILRSASAPFPQDRLLQAYCVERFWRTRGSCS
jgi:hypothetical protein